MPRPVRKRTIYQKPDCTFFTAEEAGKKTVQLTLDELEALRLMDEVGLDQKECALRMHVGRSTFQNILNEARKKAGRRPGPWAGISALYRGPGGSFPTMQSWAAAGLPCGPGTG